MKSKFFLFCLLVYSIGNSFALDLQTGASKLSSNYVNENDCIKLRKKYSSKYNEQFFNNLFSIDLYENAFIDKILFNFREVDGRDILFRDQYALLKLARCDARIDDVSYSLLQTKLKYDEDMFSQKERGATLPSMTLSSYLIKQKQISLQKFSANKNPFPLSKFPAEAYENTNISLRERLYAYYSVKQIKKMAKAIEFTLNVLDAVKVETRIVFREDQRDNYVVDHTPSDIYRLAFRIFSMERKKIMLEPDSRGLPFSNIDFLVAAYEMGVVGDNEITILTNDESFYKKEKAFSSKMIEYMTKLGLTVAQVNPISAPYALVGIILYNTYNEVNNSKDQIEYENFYF